MSHILAATKRHEQEQHKYNINTIIITNEKLHTCTVEVSTNST